MYNADRRVANRRSVAEASERNAGILPALKWERGPLARKIENYSEGAKTKVWKTNPFQTQSKNVFIPQTLAKTG